jgi:hypothetical protein
VKRVVSGTAYLALGALAGLTSALASIDSFGNYQVEKDSPWQGRDLSPSSRAHPYSLAHFLTAGRLPPATGQMLEFVAQRSNDGNVLSAECRYLLTAAKPNTPRWWSLLAASGSGSHENAALISSETAVTENDGSIVVAVSHQPSSGNWIQSPANGAFTLTYTMADPATVSRRRTPPAFSIKRVGC